VNDVETEMMDYDKPPFRPSPLRFDATPFPQGLPPLYASREGDRGGESKRMRTHPRRFAPPPLSYYERGGSSIASY